MVILTSRLFDSQYSPVVLEEDRKDSSLRDISRRVSRTATLDGESVIDDAGYSDSDRTIRVSVRSPTDAMLSSVHGLVEADGIQRIATVDGVFEGATQRVSLRDGRLTLTYLVRSKLFA